jgi:hypothetical protein
MGLNDVKFNLGQGGLGRPLPGQDYISGLIFYCADNALPSGFTTNSRIKQFFSIADAEAAGISDKYTDETAATGSLLFTAIGVNGDTYGINVTEPFGKVVSLGVYTKAASETTVNAIATAVAAIINAGTATHGYTAAANTATVTITARKGLGVWFNSGSRLAATIQGAVAATITQFTGGVGSKQAVWHYHISEYFRIQPQGNLYVGFFAVPGSYTFTEITTLQNYANGLIRQVGIYKDSAAFAAGDLTAINNVCASLVGAHKEIIALYGADLSGTADISTLTNLSTYSNNYASAVIGQDGAALGATLFYSYGKSITNLGQTLGAVSLAKVSESIAWVQKFNMSDGTETDVLAFANGKLFSDPSVVDSLLSTLQDYRYIFLRKFVGVPGSFFNEESTAVSQSSDYAYISDNRTIQKATRGIYKSLIPALNSSFTLNADGTIPDTSASYFTNLAEVNLLQMIRDGEISAQKVFIDPTQNVAATNTIIITAQIVKNGVARNIVVNIGYQTSIS